jgi:hypothetical protein
VQLELSERTIFGALCNRGGYYSNGTLVCVKAVLFDK